MSIPYAKTARRKQTTTILPVNPVIASAIRSCRLAEAVGASALRSTGIVISLRWKGEQSRPEQCQCFGPPEWGPPYWGDCASRRHWACVMLICCLMLAETRPPTDSRHFWRWSPWRTRNCGSRLLSSPCGWQSSDRSRMAPSFLGNDARTSRATVA
jgi:hypothetical protein